MSTIERKAVRADFKAQGSKGEFTALFSVFGNVDRDGDVVHKGAFLPAFEENPRPAVVWTHRWDIPPIGETIDASETGKGALGHGRLFIEDHEIARQVWTGLKSGAINSFSYAYEIGEFTLREPADEEKAIRPDGKVRDLTAFSAIHEWGPTLIGANPATGTETVKGLATLLGLPEIGHPLDIAHALILEVKSGARNSQSDASRLQQIHDLSITNGAKCADEDEGKSHTEQPRPDAKEVARLLAAEPMHPLHSGGQT